MPTQTPQSSEITLSFTAAEFSQLEAFAMLHGDSVTAFVHRAALDAAHITPSKKSSVKNDTSWMSDPFAEAPIAETPKKDTVAKTLARSAAPKPSEPTEESSDETQTAVKRGVAGEQSKLARGQGLVWEIRRALGEERIHGLGWTREQLAFVLKLSVVGVRKMEHDGTRPVKSVTARKGLLTLARTLENPSPEIATYIAEEETSLGE